MRNLNVALITIRERDEWKSLVESVQKDRNRLQAENQILQEGDLSHPLKNNHTKINHSNRTRKSLLRNQCFKRGASQALSCI